MKFKLPRNIISNNVIKNVLYLITLVLAVSYIINEQNLALITLILIACGVYAINKGIVISLFMAIIITNLLLTMNYFENIETMTNNTNNTHCIITRYKEHLDWVQYIRPEISHIFIYNKGDKDNMTDNEAEELINQHFKNKE